MFRAAFASLSASNPQYDAFGDTLFLEWTGEVADGTDEYAAVYLGDAFSDGATAKARVVDVEMVTGSPRPTRW